MTVGGNKAGCPNAGPITSQGGLKEVKLPVLHVVSIYLTCCSLAGSDGDNIVSHFAITYHNEASQLGVDINELYSALKTDAELNPPEWNIHGRQVNVYKCAIAVYSPIT